MQQALFDGRKPIKESCNAKINKLEALKGELAQLVECCDRTAKVRGSTPLFSILSNYFNPTPRTIIGKNG